MSLHTPPPPFVWDDVVAELGPLAERTLRLHPRTGSPSIEDSSVGGALRWPAEEAWPWCEAEHYRLDGDTPRLDGRHEAAVPLVPVAQLYRTAAAASVVSFPAGHDLLQVLWCPFGHGELYERCPLPSVYWRTAADVGEVLPVPPVAADAPRVHVPRACVVHPETVTEYPAWDDLPLERFPGLADGIRRMERESGWSYGYHLSTAPGTKLGGHPAWNLGWVWPDCPKCGLPSEHLLSVASHEFDGESWRRWLPVEERPEHDTSRPLYLDRSPRAAAADNPTGLDLGDGGVVYLFHCPRDRGHPITHYFDFG